MEAAFPSFLSASNHLSWFIFALFTSWMILGSADTKQTRWPLYSQKPVLLVWNAPTQECGTRRGVTLSLDQFDIVATPNEGFVRQNLTMFYKERLGLYPYYETDGAAVNEGLPQLVRLIEHYEKMPQGLDKYIPDHQAKGLSVIDWEEWRPLWIRNWDAKDIYRRKSRELVAQKNPKWTQEQVGIVAQQEFELSARKFMQETLRQAKSLRPNQLWGFYLFPDCYNHDYKAGLKNYTGRCPAVEIKRNDQLNWLWKECTALFPSIYMGSVLRSTNHGRLFVRNRLKEAMRLASVGNGSARPVFVYTRPTYNSEMTLLTERDLVSTIGESVAIGAAGVIFWGDTSYASSTSCSTLNNYLLGPLGHYLLNVTKAAEQCSRMLCNFRGRCLRRAPDSDAYLHLNPSTQSIISQGGKLKVRGSPGQEELKTFRMHFKCQCYTGYRGDGCEQREGGWNRGPSILGTWPLCFLLPLGLLSVLH
ncbi:hyaluronidase-2 [Cyprinodon tularosa]|uniref:hyaluronidase-2 n=1 Tax=Cyprinodon tularosa TaxID=77115 RepID=UPI0018E27B6F|nr:hyaluronidase-2 [Cyprinodon tularosa]XP_038135778.1 hyaluronidase-2 [Cyprinodon tularosa]XP_038135779.1 hyaluronidase-2 [Cyprinodon tularosa]XP_038135780.1 hyaluronidase-2 [Cyprinodon tularosa]